MDMLIAGLIIFICVHSVAIFNDRWRRRMIARMGELSWKALFSVITVVGFVLIVRGFGVARETSLMLYEPRIWLRHATMALMVPVFPLLLAAYLPGRIQSAVKHPMLAATALWAVAHLLSNGSYADVVLFGSFLVWAVADAISLTHRDPPFVPMLPHTRANDIIVVVLGLALYVVFALWLHLWLIGVSPFG